MEKVYVLAAAIIVAAVIIAVPLYFKPVNNAQTTTTQPTTPTLTTTTTRSETTTSSITTSTTHTTTTTTKPALLEYLQIIVAYADVNKSIPGWTVHIKIKNTGNATAVINKVFINGRLFNTLQLKLEPDQTTEIKLYLDNKHYSPGQIIYVVIQTTSGRRYPSSITLP